MLNAKGLSIACKNISRDVEANYDCAPIGQVCSTGVWHEYHSEIFNEGVEQVELEIWNT